MAYGESEAEKRDAALVQERATMWAYKATEEAECNKPLRAEIDRLQREHAELRLDRDAWVEQHHNRTKLIDDLQARLAAAEADRDNWKAAFIKADPSDYTRATKAAIDAAKTEVKT